jgi:hypothetical protein
VWSVLVLRIKATKKESTMKVSKRTIGTVILAGAIIVLAAALGFSLGQGQPMPSIDTVKSIAPQASPPLAMDSGEASVANDGYDMSGRTSGGAPSAVVPSGDTVSAAGADKLVITTANMELQVRSVDSALDRMRAAAKKAGAEISDLSVVAGTSQGAVVDSPLQSNPTRGPATAYVTLRVPADQLDALEGEIAKLGSVLTRSSNTNDVTEQAIDLDARLTNLRAEESRLRAFLGKTSKVTELLEVERELSRVRGDIEAMDAQLTYLKRQAARSTLTVTMTEPGPVVQPAGPTWGLREAVTRGVQAAIALLTTLVTVSIPLVLIALLVAIVVLPLRAIRKHRSAKRAAQNVAEDPEGTE